MKWKFFFLCQNMNEDVYVMVMLLLRKESFQYNGCKKGGPLGTSGTKDRLCWNS